MVRFHGKTMVRKTFFFWILCGNVKFFRKNVGACQVICKN